MSNEAIEELDFSGVKAFTASLLSQPEVKLMLKKRAVGFVCFIIVFYCCVLCKVLAALKLLRNLAVDALASVLQLPYTTCALT